MYEIFSGEPQFFFSIIAAVIVFGVPALAVLCVFGMSTWRKHQATKMENELKAEMVAAGMSAAEIERVLAAKANPN